MDRDIEDDNAEFDDQVLDQLQNWVGGLDDLHDLDDLRGLDDLGGLDLVAEVKKDVTKKHEAQIIQGIPNVVSPKKRDLHTEVVHKEVGHKEVVHKEVVPEPSDLSLSTITMTSNINRLLNLGIVTRYLGLNQDLDGIKCEGVGSYGKIPVSKKKKKDTVDVDPIDSADMDDTNSLVGDTVSITDIDIDQEDSGKKPNKRPNKHRLKADFFNQCTIYVYPHGPTKRDKPINIKLFNNGQTVLTGVKDDKEAHPAIQAIVKGLNSITLGEILYKALTTHDQEFNDKEFEKYLKINIGALESLLLYAMTKCQFLDDLKVIVNLKTGEDSNKTILRDLLDELIRKNNMKHKAKKIEAAIAAGKLTAIIPIWNPIIDGQLMILIKIYQICLMYVTSDDLLCININTNTNTNTNTTNTNTNTNTNTWLFPKFVHPVLDHIIANYDVQHRTIKATLPAFIRKTVDDVITYKPEKTRIDMINSFFYAKFEINRVNIQQLLVNKYKISADYKPDSYQGVNAKVVSRSTCKDALHKMCQCKKRNCGCTCTCCEISVFIFRKGTIIITGAKAWSQVVDVSKQIQKILAVEYPNISLKSVPKKVKVDTLPDKVIVDGCVWLRKGYIKNNPKNYFLIKEFKLM